MGAGLLQFAHMAFLRPLLLGWSCFIAACFSPSPADPEVAESGSSEESGGGPSCEQYCELVADHCAGEFSQYSGTTACEATCAFIAPGTEDDMLGNTVGCRIHHTILAGEQPDPHCFHAGPAGDGTCGATCESFCTIALQACTGDNAVWPNAEACIADCTMFAEDPKYSESLPDADTYACRLKHLTLASLQPDVHCPHIALNSAVCQ